MSTQLQESQSMVASGSINGSGDPDDPPNAHVADAYRVCERIARREARNFYYAFRALPKAKRNAICAVYAFMRHADDLSDDESVPHQQRRVALDEWLTAWHEVDRRSLFSHADSANETSRNPNETTDPNDPVFVALADAKRRFNIPAQLLDELVQGTAMDLDRPSNRGAYARPDNAAAVQAYGAGFDLYPTFEDLYRYCYLVASVVGLVCIHIFGYEDPRAERLAEETGIAFQLTNILRDVREDAERGRIYLPLEDMGRLGVLPTDLAHVAAGHLPTTNQRELLALQAERAEAFYKSAQELLPLIAADSRPALWVLVTIYHRLLERIVARNFDVFSERVRVPTWEKLWILAQGLMRVCAYRLRRG